MSTSWHMPVSPATGCSEHSSRAITLRGRLQLLAWYVKLANVRSLALRLIAQAPGVRFGAGLGQRPHQVCALDRQGFDPIFTPTRFKRRQTVTQWRVVS